jgi:hypothetical protein
MESSTKCTNLTTLDEIICHGFKSWSEANKALLNVNLNNYITVALRPSSSIFLTSELNTSIFTPSDKFHNSLTFLYLSGVAGLNVFPWPAPLPGQLKIDMRIFVSTIEFFINSKPPVECSPNLIPEPLLKNSSSLFFSTEQIRYTFATEILLTLLKSLSAHTCSELLGYPYFPSMTKWIAFCS